MAELYFKDFQGNSYTDEDLNMVVIEKEVPDFTKQILIQDTIPYSNQKVTYGRKKENRIITLTVIFDVASITKLNQKVDVVRGVFENQLAIGFYDDGYEYTCNLIGDIVQQTIRDHIRKYTFTFETTTPERSVISG